MPQGKGGKYDPRSDQGGKSIWGAFTGGSELNREEGELLLWMMENYPELGDRYTTKTDSTLSWDTLGTSRWDPWGGRRVEIALNPNRRQDAFVLAHEIAHPLRRSFPPQGLMLFPELSIKGYDTKRADRLGLWRDSVYNDYTKNLKWKKEPADEKEAEWRRRQVERITNERYVDEMGNAMRDVFNEERKKGLPQNAQQDFIDEMKALLSRYRRQ